MIPGLERARTRPRGHGVPRLVLVLSLGVGAWAPLGCADLVDDGAIFACGADRDCARGLRCHPALRICVDPASLDLPGLDGEVTPPDGGDASAPGLDTDGPDATTPVDDASPDATPDDTGSPNGDVAAPTDAGGDAQGDAITPDAGPLEPDVPVAPPGECLPGMNPVPHPEGAFCVDRYEAARADATAASPGTDNQSAARSAAGLLPWTEVTASVAASACAKAGKRLCRMEELTRACGGFPDEWAYPYGPEYKPGACNGYASGFGLALPSGSVQTCVSPLGVFDMSGNVQEWTSTARANTPEDSAVCVFGGDYALGALTPQQGRIKESCDPSALDAAIPCWSVPNPQVSLKTLGFRCCTDLEEAGR